MLDLLDAIPSPSLRLYHVVDEYSAYLDHTRHTKERTLERERQMLARVDAAIVVSLGLYRAKRPYNPHTYLVPNAVDYDRYQAALADPALPDAIAHIPPPRLGYTGLVGDKLQLGALLQSAQNHPEWSFVFLGQVRVSAQRETWKELTALPNVHYLGAVPPDQVPHYVKAFQVGLMPYRENRYTNYIDPLKLYDYLAVGLPIVSTDIPAVHAFVPHVHIASGHPDPSSAADQPLRVGLDQAIQAALASNTPEQIQARMHVASLNRWEDRVEQISDLLQAHLAAKPGAPPWHGRPGLTERAPF
jgi:glycosyltransferase involved in cell wall biosynthesis